MNIIFIWQFCLMFFLAVFAAKKLIFLLHFNIIDRQRIYTDHIWILRYVISYCFIRAAIFSWHKRSVGKPVEVKCRRGSDPWYSQKEEERNNRKHFYSKDIFHFSYTWVLCEAQCCSQKNERLAVELLSW